MVGCSSPLISRIVTGQQQPGPDLLKKIAALDEVDEASVTSVVAEKTGYDVTKDDYCIPISDCLLRGAPDQYADLLTGRTLAISESVFQLTRYAVLASACEPALSDPEERFRPEDLLIIETATQRYRDNLQLLHGKLCVVVLSDQQGDVVTLRRVWVPYDNRTSARSIVTCMDSKLDDYKRLREQMKEERVQHGRYQRSIELRSPNAIPDRDELLDEIPINAIVGMAVQLTRNL
jgi:hypothetical protein